MQTDHTKVYVSLRGDLICFSLAQPKNYLNSLLDGLVVVIRVECSLVQDADIPAEAEYLKVVYSAEYPALPADTAGRSFKRVFGATQSCMELFLLKRDLMGPCWLKIKVALSP